MVFVSRNLCEREGCAHPQDKHIWMENRKTTACLLCQCSEYLPVCLHSVRVILSELDTPTQMVFQCLECRLVIRKNYKSCGFCAGTGTIEVGTDVLDSVPGYGFDHNGHIQKNSRLEYWKRMDERAKLPYFKRLLFDIKWSNK